MKPQPKKGNKKAEKSQPKKGKQKFNAGGYAMAHKKHFGL